MFVKLFGASERITENLEREFPCTRAQKALLSIHSGRARHCALCKRHASFPQRVYGGRSVNPQE